MKGFIEITYHDVTREAGVMLINVSHIVTVRETSDGNGTYILTSDGCWITSYLSMSQVIDKIKEAL